MKGEARADYSSQKMFSSVPADRPHYSCLSSRSRSYELPFHQELVPLLLDPFPPGILQDICIAGDVLVAVWKEGIWFYWKATTDSSQGTATGVRWVLKEKREENCFHYAYRCQSLDPFFASRGSADASRFFRYVCVASGNASLGHSISVTSTASKFIHHHELHGKQQILAFTVSPIAAMGSFIFHQSPLAVSIDDQGRIAFFDIERNTAQWLLASSRCGATKEEMKAIGKAETFEGTQEKLIPYRFRSRSLPLSVVLHGPCTDPFCFWCKGKEKGSTTGRRGIPLTVHIVLVVDEKEKCVLPSFLSDVNQGGNAVIQGLNSNSNCEPLNKDNCTFPCASEEQTIVTDLNSNLQQQILQLHVLWSTNQAVLVREAVIHSESIHERNKMKMRSHHDETRRKEFLFPRMDPVSSPLRWSSRLRTYSFCVSLVAAEEGRFILQVGSPALGLRLLFVHGCTGERCEVTAPLLLFGKNNANSLHIPAERQIGKEEEREDGRKAQNSGDYSQVYIRHWIPLGCLQNKKQEVLSGSPFDMSIAVTSTGKVLLFDAKLCNMQERSTYKRFIEMEKKEINDWLNEDEDEMDEVDREPKRNELPVSTLSPSFFTMPSDGKDCEEELLRPNEKQRHITRKVPEYVFVREVVDAMNWFRYHPSMYLGLLEWGDFGRAELMSKVLRRITIDTVRRRVHLHMLGGDFYEASLLEKIDDEEHDPTRAHSQQHYPPLESVEIASSSTSRPVSLDISSFKGDPAKRSGTTASQWNESSLFSWGIARTLGNTLLHSLHSSKLLLTENNGETPTVSCNGAQEEKLLETTSLQRPKTRSTPLPSYSRSIFPKGIFLFMDSSNGRLGTTLSRRPFHSHLFTDGRASTRHEGKKTTRSKRQNVLTKIYERMYEEEPTKKGKIEGKRTMEQSSISLQEKKLLNMLMGKSKDTVGLDQSPPDRAHHTTRIGESFFHSLLAPSTSTWELAYVDESSKREQLEWSFQTERDELWILFRKVEKTVHPSFLFASVRRGEKEEVGYRDDENGELPHCRSRDSFNEGLTPFPRATIGDLFKKGEGVTSPFFQAAILKEMNAWNDPSREVLRSQLQEEQSYLKSALIASLAKSTQVAKLPIPPHIFAMQERDRLTFEVQDLRIRHREELKTLRDPMEKVTLFEVQEKRKVLEKKENDVHCAILPSPSAFNETSIWKRHSRTPFLNPQGRPTSLEQWQKYADERGSHLGMGGGGWVWSTPEEPKKGGTDLMHTSKLVRGSRITIASDLLGWSLGPWVYTSSSIESPSDVMNDSFWSATVQESSIFRCREIHRTRIHFHSLQKLNEKKKSQEEELRALKEALSLP